MEEPTKSKESSFFGLWDKIHDGDSATKAIRSGRFLAYYLCFSYVIHVVSLLGFGKTLFSPEPIDTEGFTLEIIIYTLFALLALWLGFRIQKNKFGSVPYVCVWMLVEIISKFFLFSGKGLFLSLLFGVICINTLRGWFSRKKYNLVTPNNKKSKNWFLIIVTSLFVTICATLFLYGALMMAGVLPDSAVRAGSDMPKFQVQILKNNGIIQPNDEVKFFYSEAIFDLSSQGQVLTSDRIISYTTDESGTLNIYEMPYNSIENVELIHKGGTFEDSIYKINGNHKSPWAYIIILLSRENNGDDKFMSQLYEYIEKY